MSELTGNTPEHKPRPLIDALVSIIIPSIILMKLSGQDDLGPAGALILALAFPISWGLFELIRYRKTNFIAILGLFSVLLTGGIGLLELDNKWLAIKEAAIPGIIGVAVLVSAFTKYPLVRTLLYNPAVLNVDKIHDHLVERGKEGEFEKRLQRANYFLAATFFFSSFMNYVLAKWLVTSPSGTEAFNEELGEMTLLSYPMIAIPSMIMMILIFVFLWKTIHGLTGLKLDDVLAGMEEEQKDESAPPQ